MDNFDNVLVVDADGHVYEGNIDLRPRMPEKWRSQAPIRMNDNEGNSRMLLEGRLWSASQGMGPGVSAPMTDKARGFREGMVDPVARLKDMDAEGIDVAILFGTQIALTVNGLMSKELSTVLCHAVNDWLIAEWLTRARWEALSGQAIREARNLEDVIVGLLEDEDA